MLEMKEPFKYFEEEGTTSWSGFIDNDYCGEEDEILLQVYNMTDEDVKIEKGRR